MVMPKHILKAARLVQPDQLPNLDYWMDASRETGYSDDDAVGSLSDYSGSGITVSQGTAAKKPTFKTSIENGLPGILFDGTDDYLAASDPSGIDIGTGDFSIALVYTRQTSGIGNARIAFNGADNDPATGWSLDGNNTALTLRLSNGVDPRKNMGISGGSVDVVSIVTCLIDRDGNMTGYRDLVLKGSKDISDWDTDNLSGAENFNLSGIGTTPTLPFTGYVFEMACWRRLLTGDEHESIVRSLAWKWGIVIPT